MNWSQSILDKKIDLTHPSPSIADPEAIGRGLSRLCRFSGQCKRFYSVAQHSVYVSRFVEEPKLKLPALLHDAHEALWGFGDVITPAKNMDEDVRQFLVGHALHFDMAIAMRFGFCVGDFLDEQIHEADDRMVATEQRDLMGEPPEAWDVSSEPYHFTITPYNEFDAYRLFMRELEELTSA